MLNKFLVAGRMTADPEIKTSGENRLCKFTIACDRPKRKGEENPETDFFPCTAWNRNADVIVDWFGNDHMIYTHTITLETSEGAETTEEQDNDE